MAMLPFCGYNMASYWGHWLKVGKRDGAKLPRIFHVNWFRKSEGGDFLWPGFGENSRVLEWVFDRCVGTAKAQDTPIGALPTPGAINVSGLDLSEEDMAELLAVDTAGWLEELPKLREWYDTFGDHLPKELAEELEALELRLRSA